MTQLSCDPLRKENNKWENVGFVLYYFHENFGFVLYFFGPYFPVAGPAHGFVHGFAHGFGAGWFSAPGIF